MDKSKSEIDWSEWKLISQISLVQFIESNHYCLISFIHEYVFNTITAFSDNKVSFMVYLRSNRVKKLNTLSPIPLIKMDLNRDFIQMIPLKFISVSV